MCCSQRSGSIEEVDEFTYLGSIVSKKGGTDGDKPGTLGGKARPAMPRSIWRLQY